jgi:hypothetical protein
MLDPFGKAILPLLVVTLPTKNLEQKKSNFFGIPLGIAKKDIMYKGSVGVFGSGNTDQLITHWES